MGKLLVAARFALCACLILGLLAAGIWGGEQAVSAISDRMPIKRARTIIVDAGHGGEDGGATSCTGRLESGYNLEIALRLEDMLHFLGCKTLMVRRTDTAIYKKGETIAQKKVDDLKNRVRLVNETEGGVLVSIHQNYFSQSQYSGAQVFYGAADGSKLLADAVQAALVSTLNPGSHRKTKAARGIYLMEKSRKQAILVECGFLSNPEEERHLASPDYQKALAAVIGAAVCANPG